MIRDFPLAKETCFPCFNFKVYVINFKGEEEYMFKLKQNILRNLPTSEFIQFTHPQHKTLGTSASFSSCRKPVLLWLSGRVKNNITKCISKCDHQQERPYAVLAVVCKALYRQCVSEGCLWYLMATKCFILEGLLSASCI